MTRERARGRHRRARASTSKTSDLYQLVERVYGVDLMAARQEDVDALKDVVRWVMSDIDEKPPFQPLKLERWSDRSENSIMFCVIESESDFYIEVCKDGAVFYHDGMGENNVPLTSEC